MRLFASAILLLFALPASADYKIVERHTTGNGRSTSFTRLVQGNRQREETWQGLRIYQCDLHQVIELNPATKLYRIVKLAPDGLPLQRFSNPGDRPGRHFKASTAQLKEQATIFGHPAWHVRDVIEDIEHGFKTTVDSWYIDVPISPGCRAPALPPSPLDEPTRVEQSGSARRGFPVLSRRLYLTAPTRSEWVTDVTELQETRLDPALFEVPSDYKEALDAGLTIPDTPTNRTKRAWNNMWTSLAKFIFE